MNPDHSMNNLFPVNCKFDKSKIWLKVNTSNCDLANLQSTWDRRVISLEPRNIITCVATRLQIKTTKLFPPSL